MAKLIYGYQGIERFGDHWGYAPYGDVTLERGYSRSYDANADFGVYYDYDDGYDGFLVSPAETLAKAELVDAAVESLNDDVQANSALDATTVASWRSFYASWKQFLASLQGVSGWLTRFMTAGPMEQVEQYQSQLNGWQKQLAAHGVQVTGPAIEDPNAGSWKPLLYGAIALASIGLGIKALGLFGGAAHAVAGYGDVRTRQRSRSRHKRRY